MLTLILLCYTPHYRPKALTHCSTMDIIAMKPENLIDILRAVAGDRHKLVILLGSFATGKTVLLRSAAQQLDAGIVNLNLLLAERLLTRPRSLYADGVTVPRLVDELCDELSPDGRPLFIDNVELLFSPELGRINPVDTFKRISRQRPVALALPARRQGMYAEYSTLGRADHMLMPLEDFTVLEMEPI